MRLTTDEILERFPSMNMSGKHYDTVQGRYYGDLPIEILSTEFSSEDRHVQNLSAIDVFIARTYTPQEVEKYSFCHGYGYKIKGGRIIGGELSVHYGSGWPYDIFLMNHHLGQTGFWIVKYDTGKPTYVDYSAGYCLRDSDDLWCRDEIRLETIERVFSKVEANDEYGMFAKEMIKTARTMIEF